MPPTLRLSLLAEAFAVCRLAPGEPVPAWAWTGELASVTRTRDELSVVCREDVVPAEILAERRWRALRVEGKLAFTLSGVFAALASPLAQAGISIFAVMTYDTDYLMVQDDRLEEAIGALEAAGHRVGR